MSGDTKVALIAVVMIQLVMSVQMYGLNKGVDQAQDDADVNWLGVETCLKITTMQNKSIISLNDGVRVNQQGLDTLLKMALKEVK